MNWYEYLPLHNSRPWICWWRVFKSYSLIQWLFQCWATICEKQKTITGRRKRSKDRVHTRLSLVSRNWAAHKIYSAQHIWCCPSLIWETSPPCACARAHTHTHTHTHTCSHTTQFPPCCVYLPLSFYLKAQVSPNSSCHFLFHLQLFFATWPVCYLGHDVFFAYLFFLTTLWYLSSRITGNFNSFAHWRVP